MHAEMTSMTGDPAKLDKLPDGTILIAEYLIEDELVHQALTKIGPVWCGPFGRVNSTDLEITGRTLSYTAILPVQTPPQLVPHPIA